MCGRQGVVLLQPAGSQVRDGAADQPRHHDRILEGHREGPAGEAAGGDGGLEEDARVLPWTSSQGEEDRLGHA